jgi:fibro-slime domain-containing protein
MTANTRLRWLAATLVTAGLVACGSSDAGPGAGIGSGGSGGSPVGGSGGAAAGGSGGAPVGGSAGAISVTGGAAGGPGGGAGGDAGPYVLPEGFTKTDFGGYKLGDPFNGAVPPNVGAGGSAGSSGCGNTILAVVRDFRGLNQPPGHPDFEAFDGKGPTPGMVATALGADSKPVYSDICNTLNPGDRQTCPHAQQTTTLENFTQWYNYAADVNKPYVVYLSLEPNGNVFTFQSEFFFPLDNAGWGNAGNAQDKKPHNFNFTTEVHTRFKYRGGERFTFLGDDDVWVFVNGKLTADVDLGGLHSQEEGTIDLDARAAELGIVVGGDYALDLFHAERHTNASHFRVDTNLEFTNCGTIVPEVPR